MFQIHISTTIPPPNHESQQLTCATLVLTYDASGLSLSSSERHFRPDKLSTSRGNTLTESSSGRDCLDGGLAL